MLILGLDVGSRWMKGTLLRRGVLRQACTHAFRRPVTSAPLVEQVAAALAEEAAGVDLLVLSISRDLVVTRNVSLPFKDLRKIKAVVPGVAEQNLPFALRDAVVRHLITDESAPAQTHLLLLVMNRRDLDPVTALLGALRVHESTAAVDSLGMVNALLAERPDTTGTICVDVGARKTSVEVVHRGRLVFSRSLSIAGDAFTAAIARALKLPAEEAEQAKLALSAGPDQPDAPAREAAARALAEAYKRLVRELKLSVLAARNLWPAMEISGIRLCGGSALSAGLVEAIAEATAVPVTVHGAALLAPRGLAGDPAMVASAGLALIGIRKAKVEADFLARPRDIVRFHRREIGLVAVMLALMLLGSWASSRRDLALLRTESEGADRDVAAGLARIGELELRRQPVDRGALDATAARLRKTRTVLAEDSASRLALVNEISRVLPEREDVSFRSLVIERGFVELEGETDSFETVQKLEESLKTGLERAIEVQPPRNEMREDKTITIFRLKFPSEPGEVKR